MFDSELRSTRQVAELMGISHTAVSFSHRSAMRKMRMALELIEDDGMPVAEVAFVLREIPQSALISERSLQDYIDRNACLEPGERPAMARFNKLFGIHAKEGLWNSDNTSETPSQGFTGT